MVRPRKFAFVATLAALLLCGKVMAQTATWIGADMSDWSDPSSWSGAVVPSAGYGAIFASTPSLTTTVSGPLMFQTLTLNSDIQPLAINGTGGSLDITTAIDDQSGYTVNMSVDVTGNPSLTVTGGGSFVADSTAINLGAVTIDNSSTLQVFSEAVMNATALEMGSVPSGTDLFQVDGEANITGMVYAGYSYGSEGDIVVENAGILNAGALAIGYFGYGTMNVTGGGQVVNPGAGDVIGVESGGSGVVQVDGSGSLWEDNSLIIGYGGTGTLTLSNGGTLQTNSLSMGANLGTGTLNIGAASGDEPNQPGFLNVPTMTGDFGSLVQFNISNDSDSYYYFTSDGSSTGTPVVMTGSMGVQITNGYVALNAQSTYSGGTSVVGGTLALTVSSVGSPGSITSGPVGTGPVAFGDNTELVALQNVTLANDIQLNTEDQVTIGDGQLNNRSLELDGTVSGIGGFYFDQTGAFTLTGANTFSGGVEMQSGLLVLGGSTSGAPGEISYGPVGTGILTMDQDANISLNGSDVLLANEIHFEGDGTDTQIGLGDTHNLILTGYLTGPGGILWSSSGILELGGDNDFQAGMTINNGTLQLDNPTTSEDGEVENGPAGTGTLNFADGTFLRIPNSADIEIANPINISDTSSSPATLTVSGFTGGTLTLSGVISDSFGTGSLEIESPVTLTADNTYSGGTLVNDTTLTVTSDYGVGYGPLTSYGSEITFESANPHIVNGQFYENTTVTFTSTTGSPVFGELGLHNSTVVFADNTTPIIQSFDGDTIGDESTITLGNNTQLTFEDIPDPDYYGAITGAGSVTYFSVADTEYNMYGFNTYTGGTTVSGSAVLVAGGNNAFGDPSGPVSVGNGATVATLSGVTITNPINIQAGGSIGGFGTFAPTSADTITIGGASIIAGGTGTAVLAPNDTPVAPLGTLTLGSNANLVFAPGGVMQFSIMNATGTPGTDYSFINAGGSLDLTGLSSSSQFFIQPVTIDPATHFQGMANFSASSTYSWTMLTAAGGITGFNSADFIVDVESFANPVGSGMFYVSQSGNDLVLNFTPVPEPSTWAMIACGAGGFAFLAWRRRPVPRAS